MPREVASLFRSWAWTLLFRKSPCLALTITFWAVMGSAPHARAQAEGVGEYQVKAAFLYNFAKFVEWSPEAVPKADAPFILGVVGEDPFGPVLEETLKGKTANGHPFAIRRFRREEDARGCQILFTSSSDQRYIRSLLAILKGSSVLTVGETEGFCRLGGIVNFTLEEDKVRFEINRDAAERARLKISSKLLSVAKVVRDQQ
ncbi:MAG: YfiR family protein [Terriglobia bacterium]